MAKSGEKPPESKQKGSAAERTSRFLRNINALGAIAIGSLAVIAPPAAAVGLGAWAGLNAVQAAGFEAARQHFAKRQKKKEGKQ